MTGPTIPPLPGNSGHSSPMPRQVQVIPADMGQFHGLAQQTRDNDHLKLLALFHYIGGGLIMLFSSVFIIHLVMGITMITHPHVFDPPTTQPGTPEFPSQMMGWIFAGMGGAIVLLGWTLGLLTIYSGRCISKHRRRVFSFVIAIFLLLWMPIGTVLGIFTIIVLQRESVKAIYEASA